MSKCIEVFQPRDTDHYFGEDATSEDSIFMDIWGPQTEAPDAKLLVIAFIHGGRFTIGFSANPLYGGKDLSPKGSIFVNFNFWPGMLGFMAPWR